MNESISSCARVRDLDRDIVEQCRGREIFRLDLLGVPNEEIAVLLRRAMIA